MDWNFSIWCQKQFPKKNPTWWLLSQKLNSFKNRFCSNSEIFDKCCKTYKIQFWNLRKKCLRLADAKIRKKNLLRPLGINVVSEWTDFFIKAEKKQLPEYTLGTPVWVPFVSMLCVYINVRSHENISLDHGLVPVHFPVRPALFFVCARFSFLKKNAK